MKIRVAALALSLAVFARGGEFRTRLNRSESVTLSVPRPAEVTITSKTLGIKYIAGQTAFKRQVELAQLILQALSKQFEFSNTKPDSILGFTIIAYEPVTIQNQTVTESRSINVGSAEKPQYQERSVPVVYEVVHGSITAGVEVVSSSKRVVDVFKPTAQIARRTELSVNGQAAGTEPKSWGEIFKPHSQAKAQPRPAVETAEGLETDMLQELATNIQRRYMSTTDQVEVFLAVDSELRLGDKLAESGQWKEALDSWNSATMKHNPSDRLYNLAVAKEALSYQDYARDNDMDAFLPKFQAAMDLYTQALHGDPSEKYMRQAVDRLQLAKTNIEAGRRLKVEQDLAQQNAIAVASEGAKEKKLEEAAVADHSPDSTAQASFRKDVRVQLSATSGDVSDTQRDRLIAFGERMKLSHIESYRIVAQEIERKKSIGQALQDYEDVFRPLAADGRITPAERAQLRDLAKREDLDTADVASVESKYHFTESHTKTAPSAGAN